MGVATFVLSTGRCGTQWLTEALRVAMGERARVEHEPLHNNYAPRRMLGFNDPAKLEPRLATKLLTHADAIERELATRDYIETGHPCWSSVPWLAERFAGRVRVLHLVRHPVPTACSWLTHGAFVPPLLPHLPGKELLSPFDAGVSFPEYRERWVAMTPLEKCLFYWAEVNALSLRLEAAGAMPWLRLRYEDLFDARSDALARLMAFLDLPAEAAGRVQRGERVDRFRYALGGAPELAGLAQHPRVFELAEKFGYRWEDVSAAEVAARFVGRE